MHDNTCWHKGKADIIFIYFDMNSIGRNALNDIIPGVYRHYKGGVYRVLYMAKHTETEEQLVVYKSLDNDMYWARPAHMFKGFVFLRYGHIVRRFSLVERADAVKGL